MSALQLRIVTSAQIIETHALDAFLSLPVETNATYAIVDADTQEPVSNLVLKKKDDALVIEIDDEPVAQLEQFYDADQGAVFEVSEAGNIKQVTAADPVVEGSDIVWQAADSSDLDPAAVFLGGAAFLGGALIAQSSHGGGHDEDTPEVNTVVGQVVAGPVLAGNDLKVGVYQADGITELGQSLVDAEGRFSVAVGSYRGVVIAQAINTGASNDHLDEATNAPANLNAELFTVGAITEASSTLTLNLNALTTIAYHKALEAAGGDPLQADDVAAINKAIANAFGLSDLHNLPVVTVNGDTSFDTSDGISESEAYGILLAAFSGADLDNGGDSQATIDALVAGIDLSGGVATLSPAAQAILLVGAIVAGQTGDAVADLFGANSGVSGVSEANREAITNALNEMRADTVPKLQAIVDAVDAVREGASGGTPPTQAELEILGITGLTPENLTAVQAGIAATADDGSEVGTPGKLQTLVTTVVVAEAGAAMSGAAAGERAPTQAEFEALGITGVTPENLTAMQAAIADTADDGSGVDTQAELQGIVDAVVAVLAGAAGGTPPTLAQLQLLGVVGVTEGNLAAVQAAIGATADDGSEVDTLAELQAVVTPVVLDEAWASVRDGAAGGTPPDQVELEALGVIGVTPENLAAVQAAIAATLDDGTEVDTQAELQALVDAAQAVLTGAAGGEAPTPTHLETLGITGVTPENLAAVQAAIAATLDDGTEVDTQIELQALVDAVQAVLTGAAGGEAPTPTHLETLGITGVTPENLAAVQAAIAATLDDGTEVDTQGELQALVDAVQAVLTGAAGGEAPTQVHLETLGISGVTPESLAAVQAAIANSADDGSQVDTRAELQTLVEAVLAVREGAAGGTPPTLAQLQLLGVVGVTEGNLAAVQAAIGATADDGSEVDTLAELQAVVTPVVLDEAWASVRDGAAGGTPPDQVELEALGVIGVTRENLAAVQAAIAATLDDGTEVDTQAELQALVDAAQAVLTGAAGGEAPTPTHLETLGITGVTPENLAAVQATIAATADDGSGVDTRAELQALVHAAQAVLTGAAGGTAPTQTELETLGITGLTPANLAAVQAAIAATVDDGSEVDTPAELQALVTAAAIVLEAAAGGTAPSQAQLETLGIAGITPENLAAVQFAIADSADDGSQVDTRAELQALVEAVLAVRAGAAGGTAPTQAHLDTLGITGVTLDNLAAVQAAIEATADDGSRVDTRAELQALVDAAQAVLTGAAGGTAPTLVDLETLGITGVTPGNLAAMQALIAATADDGSEVDSPAELQVLIGAMAAVLEGAAGGTAPTQAHLETLGITGVTTENLAAVQAAIAATADDGSEVDTRTELQSLIDAAIPILAELGTDLADGVLNADEAVITTFRVTLPTAGAFEAGDRVELQLDGAAFAPAKFTILSAGDLAQGYVDIDVVAAELGADGERSLTAQVSNAAGTVSIASGDIAFTLDATAPSITGITLGANGAQNGWLVDGDMVTVTVTLDEVVTVTGNPQLTLDIGGSPVQATYTTGSGSNTLVFEYIIQAGQSDLDGIRINANSLNLNGGTVRDAAGNAAVLSHSAVADNDAYKVDAIAPTVAAVSVADGNWAIGDTVAVTITATGNETGLILTSAQFNGQTLANVTDNGDGTYTGTYTVVEGDADVANGGSAVTELAFTDPVGNVGAATTSVVLNGESIDANRPVVILPAVSVKLEATGVTDGGDRRPQITAVGSDGAYVVTWEGEDADGDDSIFVQRFNADNTTTGNAPVQLVANGLYGESNKYPQIAAVGSSGAYVVIWYGRDSNGDYSIFVQHFNADGTTAGSGPVQLEAIGNSAGADEDPQVTAVGSSGAYVATWAGDNSNNDGSTTNDHTSVFLQRFNADGTTNGAITQLDANGDALGDNSSPQITAVGNSGAFVVTWQGDDVDGDSIFVQRFNADGTTVGAQVQLDTFGYDYQPQVTAVGNSDAYVVAWTGDNSSGTLSIFVQRFQADGTTDGPMTQLDGIGVHNIDPQITAVGDNGAFVVTWEGGLEGGDACIFVQHFNADGTTTDNARVQLEAIGNSSLYVSEAQVTAVGSAGVYVVTWQGEDAEGDDSVFVQRFNADGTITGNAPVRLEGIGRTDGNDRDPQVTAVGDDGAFLVTWYGRDSDGDYSIFVQRFNAEGHRVMGFDDDGFVVRNVNDDSSADLSVNAAGIDVAKFPVKSTEPGTIYLVHGSVTVDGEVDITNAATDLWVSAAVTEAGVDALLATSGLRDGDYVVYSVDGAGNLSVASPVALTIDTVPPILTGVALSGADGAQNGWLNEGDVLSVAVSFDEAVDALGNLQLTLDIGGTNVQAVYASGSGSDTLVFEYTIHAGQTDLDGISVLANSLSGGSIADIHGNPATSIAHDAVAANEAYKVDTTDPTVAAVSVADGSWAIGDAVAVTITAAGNEAGLTLSSAQFNGQTLSNITDNGNGTYTGTYTVVEGDADIADGGSAVTELAFTDAAGNSSERVTSVTLSGESVDATRASITAVAISSATGLQNNTLNAGDVVSFTVTLDDVVTVAGSPQLTLNIGGSAVQASYVSGSGGTELEFQYTIQAGQTDLDGIAIDANSLSLNGGAITDAAGNATLLQHDAVVDNAGYLVDTTPPAAAVTASTIEPSESAVVQSSETGTAYLVHSSVVVSSLTDITGAADEHWNSVAISAANTATNLAATGLAAGDYRVYTTDAAGNLSVASAETVTVVEPPVDTSIVVFDMVNGVSSDHSGREFQEGVEYTIYIRVDSDSWRLHDTPQTGAHAEATWGQWTGGANLGTLDRIVLVGDGAPVVGLKAQEVNGMENLMTLTFKTGSGEAVIIKPWGDITRVTSSASSARGLWSGAWNGNPNADDGFTRAYQTAIATGILTSQGLV
ncbi:Ig-like domain-containing protein [uncultured Marinobacter sp.]|uniref:Ig-like domain-containing protein n=1 Tax=uncultured Marinobacter sp. TaxID=187379 RepID=UPI00260AFC4D|nr:Ig-like domain-containing protein [uncultured Marinobacter sp.]